MQGGPWCCPQDHYRSKNDVRVRRTQKVKQSSGRSSLTPGNPAGFPRGKSNKNIVEQERHRLTLDWFRKWTGSETALQSWLELSVRSLQLITVSWLFEGSLVADLSNPRSFQHSFKSVTAHLIAAFTHTDHCQLWYTQSIIEGVTEDNFTISLPLCYATVWYLQIASYTWAKWEAES